METGRDPGRAALVVLAAAQLMIALDATIVTVALPSAQAALGFSDAQRHWIVTAYTAAFGGALLLGGRVSDRLGRVRTLRLGLAGFAVSSGLGGLAPTLGWLAVARGAQGVSAALMAPTVLALLSLTFPSPRERGRAFALFGAIAGGGGAVGLVLGGVLAQTVGWRGCLLVNVPIAVAVAVGTRVLPRGPGRAERGGWDVPGAVLVTAGLVAVVAACSAGPTAAALVLAAAGVVAVVGFAVRETRTAQPLLPLRLLTDRDLVGVCLIVALAVAAMLSAFLLLTYVLQVGLGFSPTRTGLAFLPLSGALFVSAQVVGRAMAGRDPRVFVVPGLLVAALGMLLLTRPLGYTAGVLPAEIVIGLGIGAVFTPAISLATARAAPRDAGVTAAVVATAQQVGGSVGVAALTVVGVGWGTATTAGGAAAALALAAVLAAVLITAGAPAAVERSTS